jgi:hypothetical protein
LLSKPNIPSNIGFNVLMVDDGHMAKTELDDHVHRWLEQSE